MQLTTIILLVIFIAIFALFALVDLLKAENSGKRYSKRATWTAYGLLLPALLLAFIFVLLPIVYSLGYAFTDFQLLRPNDIHGAGFSNFAQVFRDLANPNSTLTRAIKNTLHFVIGVVPLQIGLALGLALFVNNKKKGVKIFKVCFFAPVVISLSVTSFLWSIILSPSETGLINSIIGIFGAEPHDWLREDGAMNWIIILSAWQGCGFQMLIFLSGLSNIRQDLYEAASLDGANSWEKFIHVTVPGLRSTFVYIVITVFIGACRILVQPMLMTGYVPNTVTLSYFMYQEGKIYGNVGYSSAIALLMTIVMGAITLLQRRLMREK